MRHSLHSARGLALGMKPGRGARVNPAHPLARGLNGFWLMAEGDGLLVPDATPNRNDATRSGTPGLLWGAGPRGWSLGNPSASTGSTDCRVARPDSLNALVTTWAVGFYHPVVSGFPNFACRQFATATQGWTLHHSGSSGNFVVRIDTATPGQGNAVTGGIGTGWHVGVFTLDDNIKRHQLFLDGTKRLGSSLVLTGNFTVGGGHASFGGAGVGAAPLNNAGAIDFVAVWDRVLSFAEIDWLCAEPFAMFDQGVYVQTALHPAPDPVTGRAWRPVRGGPAWRPVRGGPAWPEVTQ